jgi:CRISPR-associated endonuclease/helicase Cas3
VAWRKYLPVRTEGGEASARDMEDFFDAAPIHLTECLETQTYAVRDWLLTRIVQANLPMMNDTDVVAIVLSPAGDYVNHYRLCDIRDIKKLDTHDRDRSKKRIFSELSGATLVLDVRVGGLREGLLDLTTQKGKRHPDTSPDDTADTEVCAADDENDSDQSADETEGFVIRTADDGGEWEPDVGFRIRLSGSDIQENGAKIIHTFATKRSLEGEDKEVLFIESSINETARAASTHPQLLDNHHKAVMRHMLRLSQALGLPEDYVQSLTIAALCHDNGKKEHLWQRAFNAPRDGIYAKTKGPVFRSYLGRYRHEFGSLFHLDRDQVFQGLSPDVQDLVRHLVVSHHGRGRPLIESEGFAAAPPSLLREAALDVALRFARLQKRWGPWGLAWWEALFRAADQQASKENDMKGGNNGRS